MTASLPRLPLAWLVLATLLGPVPCAAEVLHALMLEPRSVRPESGEQAVITFRSHRQGQAIVRLYGPDWAQIRELPVDNVEIDAPASATWDGRDDEGALAPAEAYFPVVEFADHDGHVTTLNPTLDTRIEPVIVERLRFDREGAFVEYALARPARVTLHAGVGGGGPLLATLLSDAPRAAGIHREPWDGRDAGGAVDIAAAPDFRLFADAVSLWQPSVLLVRDDGPGYFFHRRGQEEPAMLERPRLEDVGGTPAALPRPHDMTPEPRFTVSVRGHDPADGTPVVSGPVRVQVALDEQVRIPVLERRFEIVLFVDLSFVTEVEEGRSPATVIWDSRQVEDGERLLTVNVATLPGQMSSASLRVIVRNAP